MKCFPLLHEKDNTYSIHGDPLRLLDHESPGREFRQGRKVAGGEAQRPLIRLCMLVRKDNLPCRRIIRNRIEKTILLTIC